MGHLAEDERIQEATNYVSAAIASYEAGNRHECSWNLKHAVHIGIEPWRVMLEIIEQSNGTPPVLGGKADA
jgi:hypothetical protein